VEATFLDFLLFSCSYVGSTEYTTIVEDRTGSVMRMRLQKRDPSIFFFSNSSSGMGIFSHFCIASLFRIASEKRNLAVYNKNEVLQ
jgi:hypothetical protein